MVPDPTQSEKLARAQDLKSRGESARRRDNPTARLCYEQSVALFRELDQPLALAHTIRHLGDVYHEQALPDLADPCYREALDLYRSHGDTSSLDYANALRSLAVLRWEQAKSLWQEVQNLYTTLDIAPGIKESTARLDALSIR